MKQVPLLSGTYTDGSGKEHVVTTRELIQASLNNPPSEGFSLGEMRKRGRIDDALSDTETVLSIEDADFDTLANCVRAMKWAIRSPFILKFVEQFEK